jgi:DNA adenine methylase
VSERYLSPLRYPGGKGRLAGFVGGLLAAQPSKPNRYVEPFAGGAGVALSLLYNEYVDEVVLNDLDKGVAAFWRAVFEHTDDLTKLVQTCRPTVDEWHVQHDRYTRKVGGDLELGFATFFLNRTNRSGILNARPIGGLDQSGQWAIDARFKADRLADRIRFIASYGSRVTLCEEDGIALIKRHVGDPRSFVYADPPYLNQGDDLYLNTLTWEDHVRLAKHLRSRSGWFLTYDNDPRVAKELYSGLRCASFEIAHTAAVQYVGRECAVFADSLVVKTLRGLGRRARYVRGSTGRGRTKPSGASATPGGSAQGRAKV